MPSSVWLSHDKQKKLHSFLEHLFSQVGQLNICTDVTVVTFSGKPKSPTSSLHLKTAPIPEPFLHLLSVVN